MFIAGTETTSSTIEWAMTEILRKPLPIKKAHKELDEVVSYRCGEKNQGIRYTKSFLSYNNSKA